MCGPEDAAECEAEFGENIDWACGNCPRKKPEDLHPYTHKLLRVMGLMNAGYPYAANDLTIEEWGDLGRLKEAVRRFESGRRSDKFQG